MLAVSRSSAAMAVLTVLLLAQSESRAGEGRTLQVGDYIKGEVRDDSHKKKTLEGTLTQLNDSTMTVQTSGWSSPVTVSVERERTEQLKVRTRPSKNGKGMLIGLGVGLVAGAIIGYAAGDHNQADDQFLDFHPPEEQTAFAGALLLGGIGMAVGAILAPGAKWEPVNSGPVKLGVVCHSHASAAISLQFSF